MKSRMRCRKGCTCFNVLAACDGDKKFFYVLPGWEGSASDARVFNESSIKKQMRPGNWLLLDGGYGFMRQGLIPYRGRRYHLREWSSSPEGRPQDLLELFNYRSTKSKTLQKHIVSFCFSDIPGAGSVLNRLLAIGNADSECSRKL